MSILEAVKDKVLAKFPDQTTYPNKTKDLLDYCDKNIDLVVEAYNLDLAEGTDRHTKMVISQHYAGNRKQTKNITVETELWIHEQILDFYGSKTLNNLEKSHIVNLFNIWKDVFQEESYEATQGFLENLALNRASYTTFKNTPIDNVKLNKILNAANGLTERPVQNLAENEAITELREEIQTLKDRLKSIEG